MMIILIRTLILYLLVLLTLRLMGKGELSELQPFQLVVILMISELASFPMEDTAIPLINGIIAIFGLLFLQVLISYINIKSEKVRSFICGKPSILIDRGTINFKELKKLRITINDLVEQMRVKDYYNITDVEFAILETNGDLSIIPKSNKKNPTLEDLNIEAQKEQLPVSLIIDGYLYKHNLSTVHRSYDWLMSQLTSKGIKSPNDVLFCFLDANQNLYIQEKNGGQSS